MWCLCAKTIPTFIETFFRCKRLIPHMMKTHQLKYALLILAGASLASGCVYHERVVYRQPSGQVVTTQTVGTEVTVTEAPPTPIFETVTVSPGPNFVWIGGVWAWQGRWVWEAGHWVRPPRPGAVWVAHRYENRNGVHVFIRGGWRL
jgi:hypothetical protein